MKALFRINIILCLILIFAFNVNATNPIHPNAMDEMTATQEYLFNYDISSNQFLGLNAKQIRKATNKKVTFKERVLINLTKAKIIIKKRSGEEVNAEEYYNTAAGGFNLGGFLLGFFLPIIGNIIALLFGANAFRSSLIGTLTALIVGLIAWFL